MEEAALRRLVPAEDSRPRLLTQSPRLAVVASLAALTAWPAWCADWNPRLAAGYLDSRQKEWSEWSTAAAPGGTCLSCHTGVTYLLARPALRRVLGENLDQTQYEKGLLSGLRARVSKREAKDVSPSFSKEPLASQAMGVEAIFAALFLAREDRRTGSLNPETEQAFDRMWTLQNRDGKAKGAWPWFQLTLDPWEMPDSPFFGAAVAVLAVGTAPPEYRNRPAIHDRVQDLTAWLARENRTQPLHNRLMLLWASAALPDTLLKSIREPLLKEIFEKQQPDGSWSRESLGPWNSHPNAAVSAGSDTYATAFTACALVEAGVAASNPGLARALEWLKAHQDPGAGYWEGSSMNKHFEPGSMQDGFMRDAATGFAALALADSK